MLTRKILQALRIKTDDEDGGFSVDEMASTQLGALSRYEIRILCFIPDPNAMF